MPSYCQSSKVLCTDRSRGLLDWRTNRPAIGSVSCTQHAANRSCCSCATTQTPDTAFSCPELQLSTSRKLCDGCLLPRRALACYFVRFCQIQATQLVCQSGSIGDQSHSNPCKKPWNFDNTSPTVQGDRSSEFCVRDLDGADRKRTNAISTNGQLHVTQCIIIVGTIGLLQNP